MDSNKVRNEVMHKIVSNTGILQPLQYNINPAMQNVGGKVVLGSGPKGAGSPARIVTAIIQDCNAVTKAF